MKNKFTVKNFLKVIDQKNEFIFPPLKKKYLKMVFKTQGKWNGVYYNVYYNRKEGFYALRK